jgi:hypothetical protein
VELVSEEEKPDETVVAGEVMAEEDEIAAPGTP